MAAWRVVEGLAAGTTVFLAAGKFLGTPLRRAASRVRRRLAADHTSITSGWYSNDRGGRKRVYVNICSAPSTRFPPGRHLNRARAEQWVREQWPEVRPEPSYAAPELLRFQDVDAASTSGEAATLQVWAHGLIEISLPIPHAAGPDGELSVALEDVVSPIVRFARAISEGAHELIFGKPFARRRRLDWRISVSSAVTTDTGWSPFKQLTLSGNPLPGKPPEMSIDGSMSQDAEQFLRSKSSRLDPARIMGIFVRSLLGRSGYPDFLIGEVVNQLRRTSGGRHQSTREGVRI